MWLCILLGLMCVIEVVMIFVIAYKSRSGVQVIIPVLIATLVTLVFFCMLFNIADVASLFI